MKTLRTCFFAAILGGFLACGSLMADTITIADLPDGDTDTLSIQLIPSNGAVSGVAGATVGWGFTVDWTSTGGDWISFTGSDISTQPEYDPSLLGPNGYTDFIGPQGGPVDFGLSPGTGPWTEAFDGLSQGVGSYQINSSALPGDEDSGQVTFDFQVYNGDPATATQIGDDSYSYSGSSTDFSVTVESPSAVTPEPASLILLATGLGALLSRRNKTKRSEP